MQMVMRTAWLSASRSRMQHHPRLPVQTVELVLQHQRSPLMRWPVEPLQRSMQLMHQMLSGHWEVVTIAVTLSLPRTVSCCSETRRYLRIQQLMRRWMITSPRWLQRTQRAVRARRPSRWRCSMIARQISRCMTMRTWRIMKRLQRQRE